MATGSARRADPPQTRPTQPGVVLASAAIEVAARLVGDLVVADERAYAGRSL